ncbi:Nucleotide-binding universal stress protein, UspA family [Flaviramulus basaltis]|uniref:Nucleotide-binding universal stress protein, UspA family n=1 Tax=Flaviramulus basaltis TaxID=369401 RepID=A0A1K2IKU0_9FLAO|nr:universal stress protein [Flaviramulus basaltis]SFZ92283.1 Nucleotide-binding universal stress protein, UspA family [Flaviramulus basaltis]
MKHNVLLPTDFSKNAWHALLYALELYKNEHCNFYVLNVFSATSNVIDSLINMEPGSALYEESKLNSENGLAKVLDTIAFRDNKNSKHNFIPITTFNSALEAIKNIVEEKDIEIIVMGTRGETNSRKTVYGSTALSVMEKVRNCAVIVVPEQANHNLPKEIVFPTSYKTHFKRRELKYLVDVAKTCNAAIRILHISKEGKLDKKQLENKKLLEAIFESVEYSFHTLRYVEIPTGINCFVESRDSDMVAFINKKHKFFGSILTQPLVKDITYHSAVPILVMHDLRN